MSKLKGLDELFGGRHFDREIIVLCVRWYLRFKLSYRDLVEMMAERGLSLSHTTIIRWVPHYAPRVGPFIIARRYSYGQQTDTTPWSNRRYHSGGKWYV